MNDQPHAIVERHGHIMTVTMNRPEARNALSREMMDLMSKAWDEVNSNPRNPRVHPDRRRRRLLLGRGLEGDDAPASRRLVPRERTGGGANLAVIKPLLKGFRLTKPLIAAVEGAAIAGGTEILQGTDIRVAGESAKFGVSEVRWSLFPLGGSTVRLRRQIPYTVAADLLLTGRHLTAAEAKAVGLIGYVVPDGQALAKALEIAEMIANNGPIAVQAILRSLRETEGLPEDEAMRVEAKIGMQVFMSEDAKEGPRAFMEKRKPRFNGR